MIQSKSGFGADWRYDMKSDSGVTADAVSLRCGRGSTYAVIHPFDRQFMCDKTKKTKTKLVEKFVDTRGVVYTYCNKTK